MVFMDIFRNFLGLKKYDNPNVRPEEPNENKFRKPIWINNDDDDDDEYSSDFRDQNKENVHVEIFVDPFDMSHFESQINNIMKSFFGGFPGQAGGIFGQFEDNSSSVFALPEPPRHSNRTGNNLRDQILQREFESTDNFQNQAKADQDLDGKINKESLLKFWQDPTSQQIESINEPQKKSCVGCFSGSLSSTRIIKRSDGTIEKHQTFKDNDGNEQTIVRRQIGDKVHELITNRNKAGNETTTENFININENEIKTFNDCWKSDIDQNPQMDFGPRNLFPWHEFFGPGAKL
ncbi:uncharacterized protein LOC127287247 isoform X2 [Leptopilina boulardi]|uniref:uncharacterized protein LOC127287247 isoform X2 n=1 Tax=Leptopilina boulardi TaxID=63433 RepID=UPI0021F597A2|nr:uncharacterized protein LOC127287247 isoform X2 [Leptopilina boulardi]